jgi:hypothetical protein
VGTKLDHLFLLLERKTMPLISPYSVSYVKGRVDRRRAVKEGGSCEEERCVSVQAI